MITIHMRFRAVDVSPFTSSYVTYVHIMISSQAHIYNIIAVICNLQRPTIQPGHNQDRVASTIGARVLFTNALSRQSLQSCVSRPQVSS